MTFWIFFVIKGFSGPFLGGFHKDMNVFFICYKSSVWVWSSPLTAVDPLARSQGSKLRQETPLLSKASYWYTLHLHLTVTASICKYSYLIQILQLRLIVTASICIFTYLIFISHLHLIVTASTQGTTSTHDMTVSSQHVSGVYSYFVEDVTRDVKPWNKFFLVF